MGKEKERHGSYNSALVFRDSGASDGRRTTGITIAFVQSVASIELELLLSLIVHHALLNLPQLPLSETPANIS